MWSVEVDDRARKELRALDPQGQRDILRYLRERISTADDPRRFGKPLGHELSGLWRYRIGDYHSICSIEEATLIVLVVKIGHRREVYDV